MSGVRSLADRFVVPPFTVLDGRQGYWVTRKRWWIDHGIDSELGRRTSGAYRNIKGVLKIKDKLADLTTTSVFDPVVCEAAYRWFCPPAGRVLDPFAGGSVRGIVAGALDRYYTGIDLLDHQVAANRQQWQDVAPRLGIDVESPYAPQWIIGDSADLDAHVSGPFDFIFTCPPYADLEVYSDDPRDLSTMDYPHFLAVYRTIIAKACALLREDRFAAIVVGEVRDSRGYCRGFVHDTVQAFRDAGLHYYNEAVLVTPVGTLPYRAGLHFARGRKLGRGHQNLLVFAKGDPKRATRACGSAEVPAEHRAVSLLELVGPDTADGAAP